VQGWRKAKEQLLIASSEKHSVDLKHFITKRQKKKSYVCGKEL
jgi:hypothetical protein